MFASFYHAIHMKQSPSSRDINKKIITKKKEDKIAFSLLYFNKDKSLIPLKWCEGCLPVFK